MGKSIGIDLGTTNTVMAEKKGKATTIQNREGDESTPSIVGFYKGQIIVGSKAYDKIVSSAENTIISIKRLMGRAYSDKNIQRIKDTYQYKVVIPENGTEDDLRVIFNNKEYSAIEISSLILKKMKDDAELWFKEPVESAVITVPAYFSDKQRDATRKAGQFAGLKVQKILDEPTAAAVAYGVDNIEPDESRTILIYDLGGGTFDVSILMITGGIFSQLSLEGDMWMGGDDFDQMIMDYVIEQIKKEHDIEPKINQRFMLDLKKNAEKAKIELSSLNSTEIVLLGLLQNKNGNLIDIEIELSRTKFEDMIRSKIMESIELVEVAIRGANLKVEQIDDIILVGGSSRIPLVRRLLQDKFGEKKILQNIDAMKCVALGAAIVAARTEGQIECSCGHLNSITEEKCSECGAILVSKFVDMSNCTAKHYGIQAQGDKFEIIIPKGSFYPSTEPVLKRYFTPRSNMRRLKVPVYSGMSPVASENEKQLIVWMELPENVPENTPVDIAFELDSSGIIKKIEVSLKGGFGSNVEVFPDRGSEKRSKLENMLENIKQKYDEHRIEINFEKQKNIENKYNEAANKANENKLEDMENKIKEIEKDMEEILKSQLPEWARKADGLLIWTKIVIDVYGWLIEPDLTYKINKLAEDVRETISKSEESRCAEKSEILNAELDKLPGLILDVMALRMAAALAETNQDLVNSNKLWNNINSIQNYLKNKDFEAARKIANESIPIYQQVYEQNKKTPGKRSEDDTVQSGGKTRTFSKGY